MIPAKYQIFFLIYFCIITFSCNPVSENINEPLWNSLHNSKPFQSNIFHSADYRFPNGSCDEVQCHGKDLTGGNSGAPSCISCHDYQWTVFGTGHNRKINGYYHKFNVDDITSADRVSNLNWFADCKSCHGAVLGGVSGYNYRYSCKVCHSGFTKPIPPPGHSVGKEGTNWHHFDYENADPDNNNANCSGAACHGDGNSTGSATDSSGGIVAAHGPSCGSSGCH